MRTPGLLTGLLLVPCILVSSPPALSALASAAPATPASVPQQAERPPDTPEQEEPPPTPVRVADGNVVFHAWPETATLAARLNSRLAERPPLPALPPDMVQRGPPIHVYLAPSAAILDSLTGGRMPEWGAGVAFPQSGVIVLPAYDSQRGSTQNLDRVLRHELAHVALHRFLEPHRIPRWFNEGYARWAAGEWDAAAAWKLRLAFLMNRAPPLDSLSLDWPAGAVDAELAYLLSASAIGYLVDRSGERGLWLLLQRWRDEGSLDAAMRNTYGVTLGQFEEDWRDEVQTRYGWVVLLGHSIVFWALMALLLLVLFVIRKRRDRERLEQLKAAELPDRPAYWLGETTEDLERIRQARDSLQ